jgi:hypothetical protein
MKFIFKTIKEKGKWSFLHDPYHVIKLKRIKIGSIDHLYPHTIRLKIIKDEIHNDNNPNCKWMWIALKHKSISLEYAKQFCNDNIKEITNKYKLCMND